MTESTIHYSGPIVSARESFDAGAKRYFTGKPCIHGHIAQRMVANGACHECMTVSQKKRGGYAYIKAWRKANPGCRTEEARKYYAKYPEKVAASAKRYRKKHGERLRPIEAEKARIRRAANPEADKRRQLAWRDRREDKLAVQAGRRRPEICDICEENNGGIVFDHCHSGGHFRGWICDRCNKTLGIVKDDPVLLTKLAEYLERDKRGQAINSAA